MANLKTITSTNSVFMLAVAGVVPVAQKLGGYTADAAFAFDDVQLAEIVAGIDRNMSAGFVYAATPMKITIMPNSNSYEIFRLWREAMQTAGEIFYCDGTIALPAIGYKFTMTKGVLSRTKAAPTVGKTLQAIEHEITWESVTASPI